MKKILSFKVLSFCLLTLLLAAACLLAGEEESLRPYRLINSDVLHIDLVNGEYVSRLTGNVNFFYGDTEFYTDEAHIYETQKLVVMRGNVRVYDDSLSLYAKEVEYYRLEEKLNLHHDVFIQEDHHDGTIRTYNSDSGTYLREDRKIYSYENTRFYDESESIRGRCNYLEYDLKAQYGYATGSPSLTLYRKDRLTIDAERIEFHDDFNRLAASFDVRTEYLVTPEPDEEPLDLPAEKDLPYQEENDKPIVYNIHSDFLLYFTEDDYAVFLGQPLFLSDEAEAKAEKFFVYFEDGEVKSATLENDCLIYFAIVEDGPRNSKVEAEMIDLLFRDGSIVGIEASGKVNSLYLDDAQEPTANIAFSDRLKVFFTEDNEIETIVFTGQVRGTYKFSNDFADTDNNLVD